MKNNRRLVLTHRKIQMKVAGLFLFWAVTLIICLVCLYFIAYWQVAQRFQENSDQDLMMRVLMMEQARVLALYFGIAILLFLGLVGLHILVYTHRLTGPIYKMGMILRKSTEVREWPQSLKFRKKDAFQDLAEDFNQFVTAMKSRK